MKYYLITTRWTKERVLKCREIWNKERDIKYRETWTNKETDKWRKKQEI